MSTDVLTIPPEPGTRPIAAPAHLGAGFGEFFRYHGWLSPGVRLFRRLGFKAKALWVALAFVAPLALLLQFAWAGASQRIESTASERQGVAYARLVVSLVKMAQDRRLAYGTASSDTAQTQDLVKAAFAQVREVNAAAGKAFATAAAFDALEKVHNALIQAPAGATPDATFQAHSDYIDTALALLNQVTNGSELALDPDLDTFHMMNFSVLRGPLQLENTGRLRDLGHMILASKQMPASRRDLIIKWSAVWEYLDRDVENSYKEGIERFPEVAKTLDMKGADAASDAFREAIARQVLGGEPAGDADAFASIGREAGDRQLSLVYSVMNQLELQLQAREAHLRATLGWQMGLTVFFLALAAYMMLSFYKVMMGGLQEVASHLRAITGGNLTTAPTPWGKDEAAGLMTALGQMQASLRRVVSAVLESSAQVNTSSTEIACATNDLSRRTEQSAANLQQTAASTEQIAATVKHTAETVAGALAIVRENAVAAARGGEVIAQVVHTMEAISGSSNKIGEIIGVIDGIAFQTNILALNAAVEAARAGEAGRGFAVVASEVRALAGRSSAAAREIKSLIGASIEQVQGGTQVVAEAGTTIGDMVTNADRIAGLMNEIASATREQSVGIGQVGAAVHELDQTTQQNAALVEQTAAATQALSDQARRLADEVGFFRIETVLQRP